MIISRRQFLLLTAGLAAGCQAPRDNGPVMATAPRLINAGPVSRYAADGVYRQFRDRGFFIIRQGDKLFALSSICTHRHCTLTAEADRSFSCHCHGSTFDPSGHVTEGPARRDLPVLPSYPNPQGDLIVQISVS
jgi:Rieske Fe-S protein